MSNVRKNRDLKFSPQAGFSWLAAAGLLSSPSVLAAQFNPYFLKDKGAAVDLRFFERGSGVLPGTYNVDLYLNQSLSRRQEITFEADTESGEVRPLLSIGLLREIGVDIQRLEQDGLLTAGSDDAENYDINRIESASVDLEVANLALLLSIPHTYIQRNSRGYVDPSLWDEGITAGFSDYQANFSRNSSNGFKSDYAYLGLRNGFNIGPWRLRNESSLTQGTDMAREFSSNRSYVERDVSSLKSRFSAGELYTNGEIFDSTRIRGVLLGTDIGMLPDNETGYAPVVRGIAETHATVEVRQNGYVIYSTAVSPGAFEIRDIYPGGSNGDLEIKIIEADGRERSYSQAYSYLPVMTRRGNLQYSVAAGQYDAKSSASPSLVQATGVYGATDNLTTYGGFLRSEGYDALNLGLGLNTSVGGMSVDVTNSRSQPDQGERKQGQSVRFLYSKTLNQTDTTFTMVGYRYSTEGYRTLSQHVDEQEYVTGRSGGYSLGRQKSRIDLNVNQSLRGRGSLFFSAGETSYWNRFGRTKRLQMGYSGNVKDVSYSLSVLRTQSSSNSQGSDNQVSLSFSVPFGGPGRSHRFYSDMTSAGNGQRSLQSGVSGYLNEAATLSYSAQAGVTQADRSAGIGLGWDAPSARVAGNYSRTGDNRHMDLTASGSVVAHAGGVTFGQPVGETFALIEVPGVKGAGLQGSNARSDSAGYIVSSYAQPYRYNWANLDTQTLGSDVELSESSKMLVPRRGAIVKARFEAESGRRVQFELSHASVTPIPFGAQVLDEQGRQLAVVDNLSRALVFGIKELGQLRVIWAEGGCTFPYRLPEVDKSAVYDRVAVVCTVQPVEK
ncbi:fimbrial biogenesis outer membrane usher protein [Pseudomonas sp. ADAK18]|uniref:fimbria/pilus outer membrane usher protein n=1 Tax=Pseudomonas sp. ADAK18 TaxID=2730848 RepID=UPI001462B09E|nr:fimbria/pilus outer membrane usher protein [Pseudomonas sp. ADAK18]QJI31247.1 fimbrial biogenesis outer membrane usher protein [Pseudomonas sp. ADAK18]